MRQEPFVERAPTPPFNKFGARDDLVWQGQPNHAARLEHSMTLFEKALGVVKVEMLERMRGVNSMNAASFKWKPLREIVAADSLWPSSQVARLKSAPTMDRSFGAGSSQ